MSLPSTPEPISPIDPHSHDRGEMLLPSPVSEDDEDGLSDFCVSFDKATVTRQPSNSSFFDNVYLDSRHSFPRPVSAASDRERLSVVVEVEREERAPEYKTKPLRVKKRSPARHPFAAAAAVERQDSTSSAHRAITQSFMTIESSPIFTQPLPPIPKLAPLSPLIHDELAGLAIRRPSGPAPLPSLPSTPASSRRYDLPLTPRTPPSISRSTMNRSGKAVRILGVDNTPPVPHTITPTKASKVKESLTSNRLIELQTLLDPLPNPVTAWKQVVDDQEFASLLPASPLTRPALAPPIELSVNGRARPVKKAAKEQGQSLADFFQGENDMAAKKAAMRRKALARARGDLTDSEDEYGFDEYDEKPKRTTGGRSALEKRLGVSLDELGPALAPKPRRPPRPEIGLLGVAPSLPVSVSLPQIAPRVASPSPSPPRPKHRPPPLNLAHLPPQRGLPIINVISPSEVVAARRQQESALDRAVPGGLPISAEHTITPDLAHARAPAAKRGPVPQMQHRSASTSAVPPHPSLAAPPVSMPRSVSDSGPYAFVGTLGEPRRSVEQASHVDADGQPISFFEPETPTDIGGGKGVRAWQGIKRAVRL